MGMEIDLSRGSLQDSLRLVQGPLLSNEEYVRAVEAAVVEVGRGAGAGRDGRDWSGALKRLLMARRSPPLALWWAFSCVECGAVLGFKGGLEEAGGLVSSVSGLVHSLKSLGIGIADRDTAIAVLAPVLSAIYEVTTLMSRSVGMLGKHGLSEAVEGIGKKRRKLAKRLRDLIREVLTFLVLCRKWEFDAFDSLPGPPAAPQSKRSFTSLLAAENVEGVLPYPSAFIKFPVSSRACKVLAAGEKLSSRELADVLCAEVVLLQLLVEIIDWRSRLKKQKKKFEPGIQELVGKLKHIAVHAAATAGSYGSSEALLDMLLDSRLPVGDILDAQEESVLRGVLYEAIFVWPPFHSFPKEGLALFLKKVGVARVAISMFRSKNEHSRATCIQEKLMASIVPKDFLEWLKSVENDQKPSGGSMRETKALLGWLVRSVDDITFRMLLADCERSEHLSGTDGITEVQADGSIFYVDKKGNVKADVDEDQLFLDVADEAFASAARDIRESSDAVAAHLPDEQQVNGKLTSEKELETEDHSDFDMEGDTERQQNESGSKRPRDEAFAQAILLSSSDESEDDVVEISERDAKRVKHGAGAKLLLSSEPTPSVLEGKGGEQEGVLHAAVLAKATDQNMTEVAEVHTVEVEREGYLSEEVAEAKGPEVESMDGTTSGLQKIAEHAKQLFTSTESGQAAQDKAAAALPFLDAHDNEKRGTETLGLKDLDGRDEGAQASEDVDELKAELGKSLRQNGISEGVVTPKRRNTRQPKQDAPEESVEMHLSTPIRLADAPEVKDQGSTKLESLEQPSISDTCVTPSNTGTRFRKRQAETTGGVLHCYEPRVTRSGKVLGVSQSVEKSTKKSRKGKPLALQPIFDSNVE